MCGDVRGLIGPCLKGTVVQLVSTRLSGYTLLRGIPTNLGVPGGGSADPGVGKLPGTGAVLVSWVLPSITKSNLLGFYVFCFGLLQLGPGGLREGPGGLREAHG